MYYIMIALSFVLHLIATPTALAAEGSCVEAVSQSTTGLKLQNMSSSQRIQYGIGVFYEGVPAPTIKEAHPFQKYIPINAGEDLIVGIYSCAEGIWVLEGWWKINRHERNPGTRCINALEKTGDDGCIQGRERAFPLRAVIHIDRY